MGALARPGASACPPPIGELAVMASSTASQGRSRASTCTPRSREGTPTCTLAGAGADLGCHGYVPAGQLRYRGWV